MTNKRLRRLLQAGVTVLLLAGLYFVRSRSSAGPDPRAGSPGASRVESPGDTGPEPPVASSAPTAAPAGPSVLDAFRGRRSNVELITRGRVTRVLPDDREGARHQRFLVRVAGPVSLLVAHNLDLAERVPVSPGDSVELRGEYEWNDRGGVLHWTHRDPDGRHEAGWIRHAGRLYQ